MQYAHIQNRTEILLNTPRMSFSVNKYTITVFFICDFQYIVINVFFFGPTTIDKLSSWEGC